MAANQNFSVCFVSILPLFLIFSAIIVCVSSGSVMWDEFWESIMPTSAILTRSVWTSHCFHQETDLFNLWRCFGVFWQTESIGFDSLSGHEWPVMGWSLEGVCYLDWSGFSGWMWATLRGFFSVTRTSSHAGEARSHTAISSTIWTHSVVLQ